MNQKIMYSRGEAAQMLGVSLRLIDRAIADGELPVKRVGRRVLLSRTAIDNFLSAPNPKAESAESGSLTANGTRKEQ
jgi:excisionase family DNA binding protein